ncbi:hypothetical protein HK097_010113 [Rhizophlyctis rosea]|uniref:Uncharacterized protein n=1 Tax=Rhizophlyctis rosea TaxID=64517 RepID=A0AAD5X3D1_9FUNG|nr:hypothetical protein HK097_010113 [Rhizophlyctis rosea]
MNALTTHLRPLLSTTRFIRPQQLTPFLTRSYTHAPASDRLSIDELKGRITEGGNTTGAKGGRSVIVDICTNNEQSQAAEKAASYRLSVEDFRAALDSQANTSDETSMPRFQYSQSQNNHYVEVYLESSKSSSLQNEIRRRGVDIQSKDNKANPLDKEGMDYGAANKDVSKGTGSGQPLNL